MNGTIIQQGRFTSDGTAETINLRSDVDWMEVFNTTIADDDTQTTAVGVQFYWQRGFAADRGIEYQKANAANASNLTTFLATGGFTLLDTSSQTPEALVSTITAVSNATPPVVTNTGTNGLVAGDVVRMINIVGAQQLGGIDFTVGNSTLGTTTFSLDYMATIVAGTTGSWRRIPNDPQYYPRKRTISAITVAASAVITMTVTHGYLVGQAVRIKVPAAFGMTEIDNIIGNITAISTANNTITVDIDSSTFTAFTFALTAGVPFIAAEVIPVGETANDTFANTLDDATDNRSLIGMRLAAGVDSPAGATSDVIYWRAGKSFSVTNE